MPQVIFAPAAIRDLQRLRDFLRPKSAEAAQRAGQAIRQGVTILGTHPRLGRTTEDLPEAFREWLIDFGDSGYVVQHRMDADAVIVARIFHMREAR